MKNRKTYAKPQVRKYGDITKLTQATKDMGPLADKVGGMTTNTST